MRFKHPFLFVLFMALIVSCNEDVASLDSLIEESPSGKNKRQLLQKSVPPLFSDAISGTDIDFIKSTDSDSFLSVAYEGVFRKEMPGLDVLIDENTFVFEASFNDFKKVEIWCHSNFQTVEVASNYAEEIAESLGKLPFFMRNVLSRIVVHQGDGQSFLESEGKFFVIFSEKIDQAIESNDLEEVVFRNTASIGLNTNYSDNEEWLNAQKDDSAYVTEYAESLPQLRDLPETALFVYTMKNFPERLSSDIEEWVSTNIPNRYNFLDRLFDEKSLNPFPSDEPIFRFSISGTGIDYIKSTDPDTFLSISYLGRFAREIPGVAPLVDSNAYVFEATFTGGKTIGIWCRSNFQTLERATEYANKLTDKLGKLPVFMRNQLDHVGVVYGPGGASAEPAGKFFTIFSERIDLRIRGNQLEETVFHETAHVVFEIDYSTSQEWRNAQQADGVFVTDYAERIPNQEDIPETSIFVYTMKYYPGRLSKDIENWVTNNIPNRYRFLDELFGKKANEETSNNDSNDQPVDSNEQPNDSNDQPTDSNDQPDGSNNQEPSNNDSDDSDDDENSTNDGSRSIRDIINDLLRRFSNN